jgi:RHS repeat-associated protein
MRGHPLLPLTLALVLSAPLLAQTHPNLERGIGTGKSYQLGEIDSVALFNGGLSLAIPLGQTYSAGGELNYSFVLRYGTPVWDFSLVTVENDCIPQGGGPTVTLAEPHTTHNAYEAGLGWSVSFGGLHFLPVGNDDRYTYVSPDGSTHPFYPTMHLGEVPSNPVGKDFRYTRDGSYMRLEASVPDGSCPTRPNGFLNVKVEFADGRWQEFSRYDNCSDFFLESEHDRFGNFLEFSYDQANSRTVIHDSQGREHYIKRTLISTPAPDSRSYFVIEYIDLAAFGLPPTTANGEVRARYTFTYDTTRNIARSCKHLYPFGYEECNLERPDIDVVFLTAVTQPDGSQWSMLDGGLPAYNLDPVSACVPPPPALPIPRDQPGTIKKLKAPTGGTYAWAYQTWRNPEGANNCYASTLERSNVKDATGVSQRVLDDPFSDTGGGTWTYIHLPDGEVDPSAQESWTIVTTPLGDQSKHYFRTQYCNVAAEAMWDYGLPYTLLEHLPVSSAYASVEQYDGSASNPANVKRTSYLQYDKDQLDNSWPASMLQQSNRRVKFEKTVFADDANHYTTVDYSTLPENYDGMGHFRVVTTGGDFGVSRQTTTAYNPGKNYPPATSPAEWWPHYLPWVIDTYTSSKVSEGGNIALQESCFESSTGYLLRTRARKNTGTLGSDPARDRSDIITRRSHTSGNTTQEAWFGGDTSLLPTPDTDPLCSLDLDPPLVTPAYRVDHTYQYGSLKTSRYYDTGAGAQVSYYSVDRDLDVSTGLVATSRDSAGIATSFVYDTMGRLTWEKPQSSPVNGGAWVQHCYSIAAPPTPAKVRNYWWTNNVTPPACGSTATTLDRYDLEVDGFGRAWREYRKYNDATSWAQRITAYNGMAWKTSISEWQAVSPPPTVKKTEYLNFDPFGRPGIIRPPDGATHDTALAYTGIRLTSRTVKVGTSRDAGGNIIETNSTTTQEYDRQGRLWKVTEPSGSGGGNTITTYTYDVGGRLKQASTPSGVTQNRIFTYDNRGFLTSEQLPEVGATGNGTVTYSSYDARGHAGASNDGVTPLTYLFDRAERLTDIRRTSDNRQVERRTYATANGTGDYRNGKLQIAERWSFLDGPTAEPVRETYVYGGVGGRVSQRATVSEARTYTQTFGYTDLGLVSSLGYPDDTGLATDPARTITTTYTNGALTSIPSYATSVSYHPNGLVNQIAHASNVSITYGKDPNDMPRPASITTSNASPAWTSGTYQYDGSGNIVKIGSDWDYYDAVNRIKQGTTQSAAHRQDYTYDAFGNILTISTDGGGAQTLNPSAATNRMTAAGYDAAGRMLTWGTATYTWEPLGQLQGMRNTSPSLDWSYRYTADGERVARIDNMSRSLDHTVHIRDLSGKVLREFRKVNGTWGWSKDYVWRDGQLLATIDASGTKFALLDHLGSVRRITSGTAVVGTHDLYPFGIEAPGGTSDGERMKFTGHERDNFDTTTNQADDLDYMHARYYNPTVARFLSPDPVRGNPSTPQSWNLYAYVQNNPVNATDPDGRSAIVGWVVKLIKGVAKPQRLRPVFKEKKLLEAVRKGQDVEAASERLAESAAKKLGGNKKPAHDLPHGDGYKPHYHPHGRPEGFGHIFYSVVGAMALSTHAEGHGALSEGAAAVVDFFSPLSIPNDVATGLDELDDALRVEAVPPLTTEQLKMLSDPNTATPYLNGP